MGRRYGAVEALDIAHAAAPDDEGVRAMLAAVTDPGPLDAWLRLHPDDLLAHAWRVQTWASADSARAVARLVPDRALAAYADARAQRGRPAAEDALARWARLAPGDVDQRLEAARHALALGRPSDARSLLADADRLDLPAARAAADLLRGDVDALARDRADGARLTPEGRARFHLALADALLAAGRADEAWTELDAADAATRGARDPLLRWLRTGTAAEIARLASVAGDETRLAAQVEVLREPFEAPAWGAEVVRARLAVAEGLLDGRGAPGALRVRPELLP